MSSKGVEPEEEGCDGDGRLVGLACLVVASGDRAVLLEAVEAALDDVALLVELLVEDAWPASVAASAGSAGPLVATFGNGVADPAFAQVVPASSTARSAAPEASIKTRSDASVGSRVAGYSREDSAAEVRISRCRTESGPTAWLILAMMARWCRVNWVRWAGVADWRCRVLVSRS